MSEMWGTIFDNEDMYFFEPRLESEQMLLKEQSIGEQKKKEQKKSVDNGKVINIGDDEPIDYTVKKKSQTKKVKKRKISKGWYVAIAGTVVIGMTSFGTFYYLDNAKADVTENDKIYISIPDITGLTKSEAEQYLKLYNISLTQKSTEYSDDYKKDYIISQSPKSGKNVSGVSEIDAVVSLGFEDVKVPDLTGMTKKQAVEALKKTKLKYTFQKQYSNNIEKGKVISQREKAGSSIAK